MHNSILAGMQVGHSSVKILRDGHVNTVFSQEISSISDFEIPILAKGKLMSHISLCTLIFFRKGSRCVSRVCYVEVHTSWI